jgi:ribosomal protein S18 acetylase RimI-like enzyme
VQRQGHHSHCNAEIVPAGLPTLPREHERDIVALKVDALSDGRAAPSSGRVALTGIAGRHILIGMIETLGAEPEQGAVAEAAQLLHDFNLEYDEPAPPPTDIAARLKQLMSDEQVVVLLAREDGSSTAVGVAVMRVHPSLWNNAQEAHLAEIFVARNQRGRGYGRELITEAMRAACDLGVTYASVTTSEDDVSAQRLYEAAGFRRTEGEGGPLMLAYEREL